MSFSKAVDMSHISEEILCVSDQHRMLGYPNSFACLTELVICANVSRNMMVIVYMPRVTSN